MNRELDSLLQKEYVGWFDLAAQCYMAVAQGVKSETVFLQTFFNEDEGPGDPNPNLGTLARLSEGVYSLATRRWFELGHEALSELREMLEKADLTPWGDELESALTPCFAILQGIDRVCASEPSIYNAAKPGPLNDVRSQNEIGVYLRARDSLVEDILNEHGIDRATAATTVNDWLECLRFFRNEDQKMALPTVQRLTSSPHSASSAIRQLRIGIVSFSDGVVIGGPGDGSAAVIRYEKGATFGVDYLDEYEKRYRAGALQALDGAIAAGCHIVVFPELVIPRAIQNSISEALSAKSERGALELVVAGSGWRDGNNVCVLIDAYGFERGTYHKRVGFEMKVKDSAGKLVRVVERLKNPGETCTLVDIPGIGRILPSICRDLASDEKHTVRLAGAFRPQVVLCPALSKSLDRGFRLPMEELAERHLSLSAVCNLCGARPGDGDSTDVSHITAPGYADNQTKERESHGAKACSANICRDNSCRSACPRDGSCLHVVTIDYGLSGVIAPLRGIVVSGYGDEVPLLEEFVPKITVERRCHVVAEFPW